MFKLKEGINPRTLGFVDKDFDYVYYAIVDEVKKIVFTIYKGSPYLRYSKSAYANDEQLRLIHEWTKQDVIEWENI